MKKSSKLLIGLTFLAATATAASVALTVATVVKKTPKKQLSKQIKIFEEELETNKDLKEFQKAEIKLALEAAQAVLSNPESTNEEIKNALDVLVKKVEEIKAQTEEPETPEQKLAKAKAAYDEKVKASTELMAQLTTEDGKYSEIKTTFENEVTSAKADVPAENATVENYQSATTKLNDAIVKAQKAKETKDAELAAFETAKNAYDAKVTEATQLATQLTSEDGKYNEIKTTFDQEVNEAKALVPSENPTKENYESATAKLSAAITKATEAKNAKDQAEAEAAAKAQALQQFNTLKQEVETYLATLTAPEKQTIKNELEEELNKQKQIAEASDATSEIINNAKNALKAKLDETKAKENNEEGPSTNVEELTEAQRAIVEKVNNKTILTGTVAENVKSEILKLSSTKLSDSPNDKNYFGYLKNNKQTKTFTFGSTNKKAKTALGDNLFAQEFLDMAANKEIVFAVSNSQRLALCFDKKEDGKIVIPFRFKDKTTIYEIDLF